jgi:polyhydroxyalkanoate synthesis repressor PhaR
MAHFSDMTLEWSDRTRILQAALQLPTFTTEELSELTGVKMTTVQTIVIRSKDLIEEIAASGVNKQLGRPARYRLRESARARVAREAVELAERLHGLQRIQVQDTARGAAIALDAVDSSIQLSTADADEAKSWERRAREQLDLARRLLVLAKDPLHRTPLQRRLVQLASRLEGSQPHAADETEQFGPSPSAATDPAASGEGAAGRAAAAAAAKGPRTIWKYPNRRLYDALERRYITLADIHELVLARADFAVIEKRGRADITRSILLQIVSEREQGAARDQQSPPDPLLSRDFLAEMIRSCDGTPRGLIGTYLEQSLNVFAAAQKKEAGGGGDAPR